jgi:tRNA A-37 threonylcarbamoyl transferase component Bud32
MALTVAAWRLQYRLREMAVPGRAVKWEIPNEQAFKLAETSGDSQAEIGTARNAIGATVMFFCTVPVPEPFRSALDQGAPARVCDEQASCAEALFGRAQARLLVSRWAEARRDLEAAAPALGDACLLELAFLDICEPRNIKEALSRAKDVSNRVAPRTVLSGRAWHIIGLAEGKLGRSSASIEALLEAAATYDSLGLRLAQAHVLDTLGMAQADRGRLDLAVNDYAFSLVIKTTGEDRFGTAITLGNLGRVHLKAGSFNQAVFCFERNLELTVALGDPRGQARMLEDLGRAYLGLENYAKAEICLAQCVEKAQAGGFTALVFFARKDLALLRLAQGKPDQAELELAAAEKAMPRDADVYFRLLLSAARGELLLARADERAIPLLQETVKEFQEKDLPDEEICARISLAKAYVKWKYKALAEQCLLRGLRIARSDGFARYLRVLNEAMAGLDLVEGAIDEKDREIGDGRSATKKTYIRRRQLGAGAFGEVFQVYDPERGGEFAYKRLRLDKLYDARARQRILASARTELEAGSRVRHPGVERVVAIGTEPDGSTYIVKELVSGRPLRDLMPKDATADPYHVVAQLSRIAQALHALHEKGVVHRDLKPENILIRDDGSPVLVDFGIAIIAEQQNISSPQKAGSLCYMAPEQAAGARITGQADVYALGVIAYEWLTGACPLSPRGAHVEDFFRDISKRPPTLIADLRPDLTADIQRFIMRMLEKKARRRPAGPLEVAAECDRLLGGTLSTKSIYSAKNAAAETQIL